MTLKNLNKLGTRNKIIAITALFVVFSVALFFFVVKPVIADITGLKEKIISQKVELETKIAREKNAKTLNEKLSKAEPLLAEFDRIFVSRERDLEFITSLEDIAQKNGITQSINLNLSSATDQQTYKNIPLELTATGNFTALMNYLADLENTSYYINVTFLELSGASPSSASSGRKEYAPGEGNITMKILAGTYWK